MDFFNKPIIKKIIFYLRLVVPIVLLAILITRVDFQTFLGHLRTYPPLSLFFAIILVVIANAFFAIRWHYILTSVDAKVSLYQVFRLTFFSLFLSNFLPTSIGGDLVKLVGIVDVTDKQNNEIKVSSVIVDRLFSMLSKVLLLPFAIQFLGSITPKPGNISEQLFFGLSFIPKGIKDKINSYLSSIKPWYSFKIILNIILISWISLGFTSAAYWVVAQPFNASVSYFHILFIAIITYFAIILPISINGIGVQELSYVTLLSLMQFTYEQAWTVALIIRMITIIISLFGGIWMIFDGKELLTAIRNQNKTVE
jgi:uncharacterized membrane protein YbhN (UPF0104 family)